MSTIPFEDDISKFLSNKWHTYWGLSLGSIVAALVSATISKVILDQSFGTTTFNILVLASMLILIIYWKHEHKIKKHPKGKYGVDLILNCCDEKDEQRISEDFTNTLRKLVNQTESFTLQSHKQWLAKRVNSSKDAGRVLDKTEGVLAIHGSVRVRPINNKPQNLLEINMLVRHKPLPKETGDRFGREMGSLFKRQITFKRDSDVIIFTKAANAHDKFARYIVGSAATLSGDHSSAISIFEELQLLIQNVGEGDTLPLTKLKEFLPLRLKDTYFRQAQQHYDEYWRTRDDDYLKRIESLISKIESLGNLDYSLRLLKAICLFKLHRDVEAAKACVEGLSGNTDTTWCYSLGFLHAYEGDLDKAWKTYRIAFQRPSINPTVHLQSEEFICDILIQEPDKFQLHFVLGLINEHAKKDMVVAIDEYQTFIDQCPKGQYITNVEVALKHIQMHIPKPPDSYSQ
ncbi:MAG: hypothetical protein ACSHX8_14640 [Opitutaceae bacterium]